MKRNGSHVAYEIVKRLQSQNDRKNYRRSAQLYSNPLIYLLYI